MKKIYSYAFGLLLLAGFAMLMPTAQAHASFNDNGIGGADCPTTMVTDDTAGTPRNGNSCWPTSVSAQPGDTVSVILYYHNTSPTAAHNVTVGLTQPSGASSNPSFTGTISSSDQGGASGSASISLPSSQTLTYSHSEWYPDQSSSPQGLPGNIFSGANIGTIGGYQGCPLLAGSRSVINAFCHQGWVSVYFTVGQNVVSTPCTVGITTSTPSIQNGGMGAISWNSSNCTSVNVSGPSFTSSQLTGNQSVGPLYSSSTYMINGSNSSGSAAPASAFISVGTVATPCTISGFSGPGTVAYGNTATLNWTTQNCTSVTVSGTNVSYTTTTPSQVAFGSTVTGAVYGTTTYTLTATNGTNTVTQTTVVSTNTVNNTTCTASMTPSQTQVQSGQTATLSWYSSGCTYVTISGPNGVLSNALSGTQQTQPIYGSVVYTLNAGGPNIVNQSVTFSAYTNNTGTAPTAQTLAAQVGTDGQSATLNGYINANTSNGCTFSYLYSCSSNVNYSFQYGTSQYALNSQTPIQTMSVASGNVSAYLTGLQANTTYYFQIVASNSYGSTYGGVLSFVTNNGNSGISAITTVPTNVTSSSARLNGLVTGANGGLYNGVASVHFDYGTSPSLGLQTSSQTVNISSITNYFDTIATSANTTYYYRIVAVVNGQTYPGSTVSFTTAGFVNTVTNTNTNTTTTVISRVGTGGGSAFLQLAITDQSQSIIPGDSLNYVVTYQNISGLTLSNVVINVILPTGVTFRQASQGVLTTNNTVAVSVGTLLPVAQGTITIQAGTDVTIVPGNNLVTTATAAFTLPSSAQDSAVAYVLNNIVNQNQLAGLALFGNGFFPTTLLGWILLIGLLLILILIARYFYDRSEAQRRATAAPVTHVHYETPASANTRTGYHGDNLPH